MKQTGATSNEERYYIILPDTDPVKLKLAIRSNWRVENKLCRILDVFFNVDNLLKKKDDSAINFNIVLKVALALLEKESSLNVSKKRKMLKAPLHDRYREKVHKCLKTVSLKNQVKPSKLQEINPPFDV